MPATSSELFTTLADPTRRAIFERLCRDGEQTVWMLTGHAGVSQPAVSKHLGVLKTAGLTHPRQRAFGVRWLAASSEHHSQTVRDNRREGAVFSRRLAFGAAKQIARQLDGNSLFHGARHVTIGLRAHLATKQRA